jgi:hypothetical protein
MTFASDIEYIPKIDENGGTNREESEETDHFATEGTSKEDSGQSQPSIPRLRELSSFRIQ